MRLLCWIFGITVSCTPQIGTWANEFSVVPAHVHLRGKHDRIQLIVTSRTGSTGLDRAEDFTSVAKFEANDPHIAVIEGDGRLLAVGDGKSTLTVSVAGVKQSIPIEVEGVNPTRIDYVKDVRPILNKAGCAAAACHAAQHGKGGFKLSVFGYDPPADFEAIARASRGRRLDFARPDNSLLLSKPSMEVAHGGGKKLEHDSVEYRIVRDWITQGALRPSKQEIQVTKLEVYPGSRVGQIGMSQQLRVVAHYDDGSTRDVSALALYDAIDTGVLSVSAAGRVRAIGKGQTGVMIRYDGQAAVSTFVIPYGEPAKLVGWKNNNFVDQLAADKFRDLGLEPSEVCDDATFIRRAFLDAIGTLPSATEVHAFVESQQTGKREHLIKQLLGMTGDPQQDIHNDQYAAYWTLKWSDLIRNNSKSVGEQGMWAMHNWIREAFRNNRPFDQFVRELVTAKGSIYSNGPANFFRVNGDSSTLTEATSQLFLGVRLECAKCHHHPFEKYSQADYYGMASFFSRVGTKNSEDFGLFGRETVVMVRAAGDVSHPRTGQRMQPTPLGGKEIDDPLDRRIPLAQWLTSPENEFFAKSVANRYVGYLLGHGLVEPVDDMRSTNPASNASLLDQLASDFVEHRFDLKRLMYVIMTSRLYELSSQPTPQNVADRRFFSHFAVKRLSAEPLLDAIDQATGVKTKFNNLPLGTRAIELPDAEYPHYFLTTFAKPRRASVCECERSPDASLSQALHTINGDTLASKISDKNGRVAKLIADQRTHDEIVRELYMASLCRFPTSEEMDTSKQLLAESSSPAECYQDLMWALINSKQFLFVY